MSTSSRRAVPSGTFERVLRGSLDNLPPEKSSVIRVFLCSGFTDFQHERNILAGEAIPSLRTYCHAKGLDLQVVDLQWGAHPEDIAEPVAMETSLREIENCRNSSLGSCFVALIGDKYGHSPIVTSIEVEEFDLLHQVAQVVSKHVALLDCWYALDRNASPMVYTLRPATLKFPYYNDSTEANRTKREEDRKDWYAVKDLLSITLRAAASHALKCGLLSAAKARRYFQSALEVDVTAGLKTRSNSHRSLCVRRTFTNIVISDGNAGDYVDLDCGQPDNEANDLLRTLTDTIVPAALGKPNILQYDVDWRPGGLDPPNNAQHAQYLCSLKEAFVSCVRSTVKELLRSASAPDSDLRDELYREVLHHSHVCSANTRLFIGQDKLLAEIRSKLLKVHYTDRYVTPQSKETTQAAVGNTNGTKDLIQEDGMKENKVLVLKDGKFKKDKQDLVRDGGDSNVENKDLVLENGKSAKEDENGDVTTMHDDVTDDNFVGCDSDEDFNDADLRERHLVSTELHSFTKPIVLYGKSGSGKSGIVSMVARYAAKWLKYEPIRVLRYIGTSEHATTIRAVLRSVCEQVWEAFGVTQRPSVGDLQDFSYLTLYLQALLKNIVVSEERPILIVLDALEMLQSDDYAHTMNWLPVRLPPHVHLVVTVTPRQHDCLTNLQKVLPDDACYVEVPKLSPDSTHNLIKTCFKTTDWTVSESQRKAIVDLALKHTQPLYVRMLVEGSRSWRSYESCDPESLGDTVGAVLRSLFVRLERDHGHVLVRKTLGYLVTARDGVTDSQMDSLLSCDDTVMQFAFSRHRPPDGALIGIPPLLWKRLRHQLEPVLVEHQIGCRTLIAWRYVQFAETAAKIYASESPHQVALHAAMADYYLGRWSDAAKPLELVIRGERVNYPDVRRRAQPQPIVFAGDQLNLRKLRHLAYHLTKSHRYGDIILALCRNLEWLYYRCKAFSVNDAIADFKTAADAIRADLHVPERVGCLHVAPPVATKRHLKGAFCDDDVAVDVKSNALNHTKTGMKMNGAPEMGAKMGRVWSTISSHMTTEVDDDGSLNEMDKEYLLRVAHTQVWQVYDLLCRLSDAVTSDVNNLPLQILGQLSGSGDLPSGLQMLYDQAEAWVQAVNIPLILPLTKCLMTSSPDLITSISLDLYQSADDAADGRKLCLSMDGKKLFGTERRKNGDLLKEMDVENYCAVTMVQRLTHTHVNRMHLFCNDRYMFLEVCSHGPGSQLQSVIIDQETCEPVTIPSDLRVVAVDDHAKYGLAVNSAPTQPQKAVLRKPTLVPVATLVNLGTLKRRTLRVTALKVVPRVVGAMFSLDGRHLVVCCSDCKQHVFATETSRVAHTWGSSEAENAATYDDAHSMASNVHMLSRRRFLSPGMSRGIDDRVLYVRDLGLGKTLHEMRGHDRRIGIVVMNARRLLAASATTDDNDDDDDDDSTSGGKHVHIWKVETGQLVARCRGAHAYASVAFCDNNDGFLLTCTTMSPVIRMWHYEDTHKTPTDAVVVYNFVGHTGTVTYLAFAGDNRVLLSGSRDNTVKLWHLDDAVTRCNVAIKSSGHLPLVPWEDGLGEAPNVPSEGPTVTTSVVLSRDGENVVVGTKDGWMIFYAVETMEVIRYDRCGHDSVTVSSLLATSNGRVVSTALDVVRVWNPKTGSLVQQMFGTSGLGQSSCLAESNGVLVVGFGSPHHCAVLWNIHTGDQLHVLHKTFGFTRVAMSHDARLLVTDFCDQPALFDIESGRTLPVDAGVSVIARHSCTCLRISPDDRLVATCSTDGSVKVTDLQTRVTRFSLSHGSPVKEVVFTTDGGTLLTAGFKNILVWAMDTGRLVTVLLRHQDVINRLVMTRDDRFLVSCADDRQIIVWDMSMMTSICAMCADAAVADVLVAPGLERVLYVPTHVAYVAVLAPNGMLRDIVRGLVPKVPSKIQHAQAFALTFSSQKVRCNTSQVCVLL